MSSKKKIIAAEPAKVGRPRADVDPELVEKLASIGCSIKEIAAACNCHPDTIRDNFSTEIAKGQENGKTRLRKKQIEVAISGNVSMLIFLGKNMLGQSDKIETKNDHVVESKVIELPEKENEALKRLIENTRENVKMKP